jgi:hypothetical protein
VDVNTGWILAILGCPQILCLFYSFLPRLSSSAGQAVCE